MEDNKHIDRVLLRLRRKYTPEEEMGLLLNELSLCKIEIGKQKSRIDELNYLNNQLLEKNRRLQKEVEEIMKTKRIKLTKADMMDERIKALTIQVSNQAKKIKHLLEVRNELINRQFKHN